MQRVHGVCGGAEEAPEDSPDPRRLQVPGHWVQIHRSGETTPLSAPQDHAPRTS